VTIYVELWRISWGSRHNRKLEDERRRVVCHRVQGKECDRRGFSLGDDLSGRWRCEECQPNKPEED
jgi:hypothetical protein